MKSYSEHYDVKYFNRYILGGEFGGWANLTKFVDFIKEDFNIIDFGCGGGYLLKNIQCKNKIGVDCNESARKMAEKLGIPAVESTDSIDNEWADLVISDNALEHVLHPLEELRKLHKKLKTGGKVVFVVPCESIKYAYIPNDINHHLYSWSPMCIGNLMIEAGYKVIESKSYIHKWPPFSKEVAKFFGRYLFELGCRIYGRIETSWFQVRVVAIKE